jgi:hypothetical protein
MILGAMHPHDALVEGHMDTIRNPNRHRDYVAVLQALGVAVGSLEADDDRVVTEHRRPLADLVQGSVD